MAKFGGAFMALFLDKKARTNLKNKPTQSQNAAPHTPPAPQRVENAPQVTPEGLRDRLVEAEQEMEQKRSPDRLELIKNAMKIRNEQTKILDQLSKEQRQKLQDIAVNSFLNGGKD